jgi:hypothetical protein
MRWRIPGLRSETGGTRRFLRGTYEGYPAGGVKCGGRDRQESPENRSSWYPRSENPDLGHPAIRPVFVEWVRFGKAFKDREYSSYI